MDGDENSIKHIIVIAFCLIFVIGFIAVLVTPLGMAWFMHVNPNSKGVIDVVLPLVKENLTFLVSLKDTLSGMVIGAGAFALRMRGRASSKEASITVEKDDKKEEKKD